MLLKASRPKLAPLFLVAEHEDRLAVGSPGDLTAEIPSRRAGAGGIERERSGRREAQLRSARAALDERDDVRLVRRRERRVDVGHPRLRDGHLERLDALVVGVVEHELAVLGVDELRPIRDSTQPPPAFHPTRREHCPDGFSVLGLIDADRLTVVVGELRRAVGDDQIDLCALGDLGAGGGDRPGHLSDRDRRELLDGMRHQSELRELGRRLGRVAGQGRDRDRSLARLGCHGGDGRSTGGGRRGGSRSRATAGALLR